MILKTHYFTKNIKIIFSIVLFICILSNCQKNINKPQKDVFGSAKIVSLYGSWYQMGLQYGNMLKEELNDVYKVIYLDVTRDETSLQKAIDRSEQIYSNNPNYVRQFFDGVSQSSNISLDKIKLINAIEYNIHLPACTGLAVNGEFTTNGNLIYGRNYDYNSYMKKINKDIVICVYHPNDGSLAGATIGYVGQIYAVNGLNEKGIFFELNNGSPSGGKQKNRSGFYGTTSLFKLLFEIDSLDYAKRFFNAVKCDSSFIIGFTDGTQAISFEWDKENVKLSDDTKDGKMIITNYYKNPEWSFPIPSNEKCFYSFTREQNLEKLVQQNKGKIDVTKVCNFMETSISNGGPMFEDLTVYQLVYDSENMDLWIKVRDLSDWTKVNIAKYF